MPLHVVRSVSAVVVNKTLRMDSSEPTDWLCYRGASQDTWLLVLHPPLLTSLPTARDQLLAADHVVQTAPNFFSHHKTMGKGLRGPGNCSAACACGDVVMLVMLCVIALVPQ